MDHNNTPTDYSTVSSLDDDLAHRIALFKAELDRRNAENDHIPYKKGDLQAWAREVFEDAK
jgi:uncharacterized small protein (DUF1192 family)